MEVMKEKLKIIKEKEKEFIYFILAEDMKVIGRTIKEKE